jgi:hypothetical protein
LAITLVLNVAALFLFKLGPAQFFSVSWWACWFPAYGVWMVFAMSGFTKAPKKSSV